MIAKIKELIIDFLQNFYQRLLWQETKLSDGRRLDEIAGLKFEEIHKYFSSSLKASDYSYTQEILTKTQETLVATETLFSSINNIQDFLKLLEPHQQYNDYLEDIKNLRDLIESIEKEDESLHQKLFTELQTYLASKFVQTTGPDGQLYQRDIRATNPHVFFNDFFAFLNQTVKTIKHQLDYLRTYANPADIAKSFLEGTLQIKFIPEGQCMLPNGWQDHIDKIIQRGSKKLALLVVAEEDWETLGVAKLKARKYLAKGLTPIILINTNIDFINMLNPYIKAIDIIGHWIPYLPKKLKQQRPVYQVTTRLAQKLECNEYPLLDKVSLRACHSADVFVQQPHRAIKELMSNTAPTDFLQHASFEILDVSENIIPNTTEELLELERQQPHIIIIKYPERPVCRIFYNDNIFDIELDARFVHQYDNTLKNGISLPEYNSDIDKAIRKAVFNIFPALILGDLYSQEQKQLIKQYLDEDSAMSKKDKEILKTFYPAAKTFNLTHQAELPTLLQQSAPIKPIVKAYVQAIGLTKDEQSIYVGVISEDAKPSKVGPKALLS